MKDVAETTIETVLSERISYVLGGETLIATMKAAGSYTALVSGGLTALSQTVAQTLGFDEHRANRLIIEEGRLTGAVADPILGREAKVEALEDLTQKLALTDEDVIAVGDGANDLGMLKELVWELLHAKPAVAAECDVKINFGDLTALLYLQGYHKDAFVTP